MNTEVGRLKVVGGRLIGGKVFVSAKVVGHGDVVELECIIYIQIVGLSMEVVLLCLCKIKFSSFLENFTQKVEKLDFYGVCEFSGKYFFIFCKICNNDEI